MSDRARGKRPTNNRDKKTQQQYVRGRSSNASMESTPFGRNRRAALSRQAMAEASRESHGDKSGTGCQTERSEPQKKPGRRTTEAIRRTTDRAPRATEGKRPGATATSRAGCRLTWRARAPSSAGNRPTKHPATAKRDASEGRNNKQGDGRVGRAERSRTRRRPRLPGRHAFTPGRREQPGGQAKAAGAAGVGLWRRKKRRTGGNRAGPAGGGVG